MQRAALIDLLSNNLAVTADMLAEAAGVSLGRARSYITTLEKNDILRYQACNVQAYIPGPNYSDFAKKPMYIKDGYKKTRDKRQAELAHSLRFAISRSGKTLYQLEKQTQVHRQTIQNACKGAQIKAEDWLALAEVLQIKHPSMISI